MLNDLSALFGVVADLTATLVPPLFCSLVCLVSFELIQPRCQPSRPGGIAKPPRDSQLDLTRAFACIKRKSTLGKAR